MSSYHKVIIVEKLTCLTIFFFLSRMLRGWLILYCDASSNSIRIIEALGIKHSIQKFNFGAIYMDRPELYFSMKSLLAEALYNKHKIDDLLDVMLLEMNVPKLNKENLRCLMIDTFMSIADKVAHLSLAAVSIAEKGSSVLIHGKYVRLWRALLGVDYEKKINAKITFAYGQFIFYLESVSQLIWKKLSALIHVRKMAKNEEVTHADVQNNCEVLYFPHKGVVYGKNVYSKDYIYSSEPSSRFNKKNMLHIEYKLTASEIKNIVENYSKDNYNWLILRELNPLSFLKKFISESFNQKQIAVLYRRGLFVHLSLKYIQFSIQNYVDQLKFMRNVRLAYVDWDALFPKNISAALMSLEVRSIAIQVRSIITHFPDMRNMMYDYYGAYSQYSKQALLGDKYATIGKVVPMFSPKLYKALSYIGNVKQTSNTRKKILCYDYNSDKDLSSALQPITNWDNNNLFYIDIIRLSEMYPDCDFIIRGVDTNWCEIPFFSDTYYKIQRATNIEINGDYSKPGVSYELLKDADLVIAKYSSIVDECYYADFRVIVHDYGVNHNSMFSNIYGGKKIPLYVHSFDELHSEFHGLLFDDNRIKSYYMSLNEEKNFLYGNMSDQNPTEQLHQFISDILSDNVCEVS